MHKPTLLWFVTTWLIALIERLRCGFETNIWGAIGAPRGKIALMLRELMHGEARLLKAIRNGALRELGLPLDRRPWKAFEQPLPKTARAFAHRLVAYRNMLRDPEACVQRLVARVRRDMALSPRDRACADDRLNHPPLAPAPACTVAAIRIPRPP